MSNFPRLGRKGFQSNASDRIGDILSMKEVGLENNIDGFARVRGSSLAKKPVISNRDTNASSDEAQFYQEQNEVKS